MTQPELTTLFFIGVVFLIVGLGLVIYGIVEGKKSAGPAEPISPILEAIAKVFEGIAKLAGDRYRASGIGLVLIVFGFVLVLLSLFVHASA